MMHGMSECITSADVEGLVGLLALEDIPDHLHRRKNKLDFASLYTVVI